MSLYIIKIIELLILAPNRRETEDPKDELRFHRCQLFLDSSAKKLTSFLCPSHESLVIKQIPASLKQHCGCESKPCFH